MRPLVLLAATILVAAVLAGCSGSDESPAAGARLLTVDLSELKFEPANLTVSAGTPVQITLRNTGTTEHDFVIMGMPAKDVKSNTGGDNTHGSMDMGSMNASEIAGHTKAKEQVNIRFTPTQPGTYDFYCSIPGHREAGMTGKIIVS